MRSTPQGTSAADLFRATVLPGASPACTRTVSGVVRGVLIVREGVTCLRDAEVRGAVVVRPGASLVASGGSIRGALTAEGAAVVQLFGTEVRGAAGISGTAGDVTAAGARFRGVLMLTVNAARVILAGNEVRGRLACYGNASGVSDFGADNDVRGVGDCADL